MIDRSGGLLSVPPGLRLVLLAQADGPWQATAVGQQFPGRVGLFLRVDSFDAQYERMMSQGIEFVIEPGSEPYGQVAVFLDVAGNRWDLLGPPDVAPVAEPSPVSDR